MKNEHRYVWRNNKVVTHFACLEVLKSEVEAFGAPWPALISLMDTLLSWLSYILGESKKIGINFLILTGAFNNVQDPHFWRKFHFLELA